MLKDLLQGKQLKGKRTIIIASVMAVLTFLKVAAIIDANQYATIVGFLTSIGLLTSANHDI